MKIGVISDTHRTAEPYSLPQEVIARLLAERVELILHAGDVGDQSVLDELEAIAELRAVSGNMDPPALKASLPNRLVEEADGLRIGLIHGSGPPTRLGERLLPSFEADNIDVLVYGHSHVPENVAVEAAGRKVLLFNPGSLKSNRDGGQPSFGILTIENGRVSGEIIRIG